MTILRMHCSNTAFTLRTPLISKLPEAATVLITPINELSATFLLKEIVGTRGAPAPHTSFLIIHFIRAKKPPSIPLRKPPSNALREVWTDSGIGVQLHDSFSIGYETVESSE